MKQIMGTDKTVTMNSLEIAELTGKSHGNVMRDIRNMFEELEKDAITFESIYKDTYNRDKPCYKLDKLHTETLILGYSAKLRMKVLVRLNELEQKNQTPAIPQTYAEALRLAADQAEQLALAAPKVSYYDKVVERDTLLNATQVGQKIGLSAVMLNRHLDDLGVYNKSIKRGRAFRQSFVDAGHGIMRQTETGHAQPMITLTGEAWIIEKLTSEGVI